jgi:tetratricopeptide (TPR) repeat protein
MPAVRACGAGAVFLTIAVGLSSAFAQPLPDLTLDAYPAVSREPIARALADARAQPQDAAATGRLGMLLHAWEQWESAAAVYGRARQLERRFDWCYLGGIVEARLAHHGEAAALFKESVALRPAYLPARLKLADAWLESGALDDAERAFAALTGDPQAEPHAHYGLGRVLSERGRHEQALAEFDRAVRLYPEFGAAWYSRGLALRNLARLDDARDSLARAAQYGTRWPGVPDPVLAEVRALRDDGQAHLARGLALERDGDIPGAVREHEAAVGANPQLAQAYVNLISLYGRQQQWARAEAAYRDATRLGYRGADAHYNFGVALLLQDRAAEAAAAFEQAVAANPLHAGAWNNLAGIAEQAGRLDQALERSQHAVDAAPGDPLMRFNLGRMLIANGRAHDAIAHFERLAQGDKPDPRFVYGLATAWVQSGDVAKGRQVAQRARELAAAQGLNDLVAAIDRDLAGLPQ